MTNLNDKNFEMVSFQSCILKSNLLDGKMSSKIILICGFVAQKTFYFYYQSINQLNFVDTAISFSRTLK